MYLDKLYKVIDENKNPVLFENSKTKEDFWDNEHISKMMLMAHLNPNWDVASRRNETIKATCDFIIKKLNLKANEKLLDLGCGPGLYSTKFHEHGLLVTGIDYSKRSLEYANKKAVLNNYNINYLYMDYLDLNYEDEFDIVVIIYCDFGVLSNQLREKLLKKIYKSLKPNGYLVFDVWSTSFKELNTSYKTWKVHEKQGFWKSTPHLELINKIYYENEKVSLKQHFILEENDNISVYNLWEQVYTKESVVSLISENGFRVVNILGDLTGKEYLEASNTIGIIAQKA